LGWNFVTLTHKSKQQFIGLQRCIVAVVAGLYIIREFRLDSLPVDLNDDVEHQRSTMTEILVWADTATTYDLSDTLDAMMKELTKAVNAFPKVTTTEIFDSMRPFWSSAAGELDFEISKLRPLLYQFHP
jgi:hypothetical protein